jgi:hypothetical protein
MPYQTDQAYYASRARDARRMAQAACNERVRAIHNALAGNYEGRAATTVDARPQSRFRVG